MGSGGVAINSGHVASLRWVWDVAVVTIAVGAVDRVVDPVVVVGRCLAQRVMAIGNCV